MRYKHKDSGGEYRFLLNAFNVDTQKENVVYVSLSTGEVFTRDGSDFSRNFKFIGYSQVTPKTEVREDERS